METIQQAVDLAGSQSKLAEMLGITPQAVQIWCSNKRKVPVTRAIAIEKLFPGEITRAEIRPDIFCDIPDATPSVDAA